MAALDQYIAQGKRFWSSRTKNQRIVLGAGAVATAGVLAVFATLMSSQDMKPLMTGLEAADAQAISSELTSKKIPFQLSPDGKSISVPADQLETARMDVASTQTTHSGRMGFEIFDKVSWGQTEFDEKVNYQRALEGELERTIMTLSNVKSARVHLVMASDSVFIDRERGAKGSVTLKLGRGGLTHDETSSIQKMVSGAVDGLKPGDVSIIDADSNQAIGSTGDMTPGEEGAERQLTQRLIATLAPVLGADHLRASVNVEYDPTTTEENQETYDPAVSVPLTMQRSDETSGAGTGVGGVPGTTSNVPQKANVPPPIGDDASQVSKTESATYGVNKVTRHSIAPAGRIRRLSAALVVDDHVTRRLDSKGKWTETRVKRSPQEMQQIQTLAQSAIGIDASRGDVLMVQNLSFDAAGIADVPPVTMLDQVRRGMTDYSTAVRYVMLLVLFGLTYLLMLRPMQKKVFAGALEAPMQPALPEGGAALALASSGDELVRTLALKEHLVLQAKAEPSNSARLVQAWLRGEGE